MSQFREFLAEDAPAFFAELKEEAPPSRGRRRPRSVQEAARMTQERTLQSGARMTPREFWIDGVGLGEAEAERLGVLQETRR